VRGSLTYGAKGVAHAKDCSLRGDGSSNAMASGQRILLGQHVGVLQMNAPTSYQRHTATLRIGSLYSGIAGLEVGLLAAFVEAGVPTCITWQCEIDPFCSRVLSHHFPDVQRFSDVSTVTHPPSVDVLCGGFACQDVSAAGKGAGLGKETRSGFTLHHLLRIIDEIVPPYLVVENVASGAKRWLPRVVQELRDRGYRPRAVPLGAVDVGAPHRRNRVFVVADRGRREGERRRGVLDGEWPSLGNDVDGCRGAMAYAIRSGLEVEREQQAWRQLEATERGGGTLPDPERVQLRDKQGRRGGARGADPGELGDHGEKLAHPDEHTDLGSGSQLGQRAVSATDAGIRRIRSTQSGVGGHPDGLPFDVAGHCFPAGRGAAQESWEPPRALSGSIPMIDRPAKLRALGNAVVPQCGLVVGRVIVAMMYHGLRAADDTMGNMSEFVNE